MKRSKYGMTALTRVCWSMISETHVRYGVTTLRHGSVRPFKSYHVSSGAVRAFKFSQCSVIISFVEARGEAAAAAEFFGGLPPGEALAQSTRARGVQNFRKRLSEEVPQRHIALMIEAAGHDRAVDKHAELVAQAVAELCAGFAGAQIGPVEFARTLQIQVVAQKKAPVSHLGPVIACAGAQKVENFAVARVRAAVVPEAQRDDDAFFAAFSAKFQTCVR